MTTVCCVKQAPAPDAGAPAEEAAEAALAAGKPAVEATATGSASELAAEAVVAEPMEEDSDDDDWETMDVDAIKLPNEAAAEQVNNSMCFQCAIWHIPIGTVIHCS